MDWWVRLRVDDFVSSQVLEKTGLLTSIAKFCGDAAHAQVRDDYVDIVIECITREGGNDVDKACQRMNGFAEIREFKSTMSTAERRHVDQQLKDYLALLRTDSVFDLVQTVEYHTAQYEVAVRARKDIKAGQAVKFLAGVLTKADDAREEQQHKEGALRSVILSDRWGQFFLGGAARFCNSKCGSPTARLTVTSGQKCDVVALRNIRIGEEITVDYGPSFFGDENQDCMCSTCQGVGEAERKKRYGDRCNDGKVSYTDDASVHDRVFTWGTTEDETVAGSDILMWGTSRQMIKEAECYARLGVSFLQSEGRRRSQELTRCRNCRWMVLERLVDSDCSFCDRHMRLYGHRWPQVKEVNAKGK